MLDGDSDLARNNALTSKVGQTLDESQRGFDKWAPTYEQVSFIYVHVNNCTRIRIRNITLLFRTTIKC